MKGYAAEKGFSVVELGITICVTAVLATVVVVARGFVEQSRVVSTAQMVDTLRRAANAYAERVNGGRSYDNITIESLKSEGFVPVSLSSPWDTIPTLYPANGGQGVHMRLCLPNAAVAGDLASALNWGSIRAVRCASCNRYCIDASLIEPFVVSEGGGTDAGGGTTGSGGVTPGESSSGDDDPVISLH